jgi:hypothetical protein
MTGHGARTRHTVEIEAEKCKTDRGERLRTAESCRSAQLVGCFERQAAVA